MTKKKKETKVEESIVEETVVAEAPVVETPKVKEVKPKATVNKWEIKDRMYYLVGNKKPVSYSMRACNLFWFDEEVGYER